jgi:hypothetical protein
LVIGNGQLTIDNEQGLKQMTPNLDIINARVPGYQGLQQIRIDAQGLFKQLSQWERQFMNCP